MTQCKKANKNTGTGARVKELQKLHFTRLRLPLYNT